MNKWWGNRAEKQSKKRTVKLNVNYVRTYLERVFYSAFEIFPISLTFLLSQISKSCFPSSLIIFESTIKYIFHIILQRKQDWKLISKTSQKIEDWRSKNYHLMIYCKLSQSIESLILGRISDFSQKLMKFRWLKKLTNINSQLWVCLEWCNINIK